MKAVFPMRLHSNGKCFTAGYQFCLSEVKFSFLMKWWWQSTCLVALASTWVANCSLSLSLYEQSRCRIAAKICLKWLAHKCASISYGNCDVVVNISEVLNIQFELLTRLLNEFYISWHEHLRLFHSAKKDIDNSFLSTRSKRSHLAECSEVSPSPWYDRSEC